MTLDEKNDLSEIDKLPEDVVATQPEKDQEKLPYPKSVFFIISNEFCERFSYYGMRTILSLYLKNTLKFSESDSTIIYHLWTMMCYFFPIIGAIISDSWLGKFRTILYVSMIYAAGNILLAVAAVPTLNIPQIPFSMVALFLIALGTGGIKPCVSAFGGDQFVVPQQNVQLAAFFSVFYFSINAGSLISTFITPILREDVKCFGDSCYSLAFGIPGILMVVAIIIFVLGSRWYKMKQPEGNILVQSSKCIANAISEKKNQKAPVEHWLDRAVPKYGQEFVNDIKITLKILVVFIPLPIFWSLYDQQGTRWTFQANRMDGRIGSFTLLPDQMQVINPILILALIPIFTYGVYPFFTRLNILKDPLQRMVVGGFLGAAAFAISAGVAFALEATDPALPSSGAYQLRLYNPLPNKITDFFVDGQKQIDFDAIMFKKMPDLEKLGTDRFVDYSYIYNGITVENKFNFTGTDGVYYAFGETVMIGGADAIEKPDDGMPLVRSILSSAIPTMVTYYTDDHKEVNTIQTDNTTLLSYKPGTYYLQDSSQPLEFKLGGVYSVVANLDSQNKVSKMLLVEVTEPSSVHILWLLPQYFVITVAEIFISITGLEFSYSQAPVSMKSIMSALFLLTSAFGNLLIVIIESIKIFDKQSSDYLLYVGLMIVDMIIFAILTRRFKPPKPIDIDETEQKADLKEA